MWIIERLTGWHRVARVKICIGEGDLSVRFRPALFSLYRLPSAPEDSRPVCPAIEEFRFWLCFHTKLIRWLDTDKGRTTSATAIEFLRSLTAGSFSDETTYTPIPVFDSDGVPWRLSASRPERDAKVISAIYLEKQYGRLAFTYFPVSATPNELVAASAVLLGLAARHDYVRNRAKMLWCIEALYDAVLSEPVLSLRSTANLPNYVFFS